jgi:hypothetical protein
MVINRPTAHRSRAMNTDFRIEKDKRIVSLLMLGGEQLSGEMFVQRYSRYHVGSEEVPDVLNSPEPFFPLVRAGDTLMVAKHQVREIELVDDSGVEAGVAPGARAEAVEVTLRDGTVRSGRLYLEMPTDRPRLLDYLNRYAQRFVTLYSAGGIRLINRELIERVRPMD